MCVGGKPQTISIKAYTQSMLCLPHEVLRPSEVDDWRCPVTPLRRGIAQDPAVKPRFKKAGRESYLKTLTLLTLKHI